jgi:hypothetical protein
MGTKNKQTKGKEGDKKEPVMTQDILNSEVNQIIEDVLDNQKAQISQAKSLVTLMKKSSVSFKIAYVNLIERILTLE